MKTIVKLLCITMLTCIGNYALAQTPVTTEDKPTAFVANKLGGLIDKKELIDAKKLLVKFPNSDKPYQVISFSMTRTGKDKDPVDISSNKGDAFTDDMMDVLRKATAGDKIYFENIKVKNAEGAQISIPALAFVVK